MTCFTSVALYVQYSGSNLTVWGCPVLQRVNDFDKQCPFNACTRVPTVFLENWKTKMHFNFQFSFSKKFQNWNSTSNFNFQSLRKTKVKFDINFLIFNFHKKWKLKFGYQFSCFNFSIPTSVLVSYFRFMKVRESLDRTITGNQRTTKTNSFGAKFQNGGAKQYSGPRIWGFPRCKNLWTFSLFCSYC